MTWRNRLGRVGGARGGEARLLPSIPRLAAAVAAVAGVAVLALGTHSAEAASPPQKKLMWGPVTMSNGQSFFPTYRDLGVGIYATTVHWDQVAPTKPVNPTDPNDPAYTWPSYVDYAVSEAAKYGIRVQLLIRGVPSWANGGRGANYVPTQISDWTNFVTAIAKKYPTVNLWMIWGEPNRGGPTFAPFTRAKRPTGKLNKAEQVAPRNYAVLLDAAYAALKAVNPNNLVIGGNTYTAAGNDDINTYQWIQYMKLPNGSRPRMDLYGHNPFGFDKPSFKGSPSPKGSVAFTDLRRLVKRLDKAFRGQRLKLYLAEWGVPIGFKDGDLLYSLKPKEGKAWIRAGFKLARWGRIFTLGWIHPQDTDRNSVGLLDRGGRKKPSYNVYKKS